MWSIPTSQLPYSLPSFFVGFHGLFTITLSFPTPFFWVRFCIFQLVRDDLLLEDGAIGEKKKTERWKELKRGPDALSSCYFNNCKPSVVLISSLPVSDHPYYLSTSLSLVLQQLHHLAILFFLSSLSSQASYPLSSSPTFTLVSHYHPSLAHTLNSLAPLFVELHLSKLKALVPCLSLCCWSQIRKKTQSFYLV